MLHSGTFRAAEQLESPVAARRRPRPLIHLSLAAAIKPSAEGRHLPVYRRSEVFSPATRSQSKGAVGAAGQGCSESSGAPVAAPDAGSCQATLDARWPTGLTCSDASPRHPRRANPGEKTSMRFSHQESVPVEG